MRGLKTFFFVFFNRVVVHYLSGRGRNSRILSCSITYYLHQFLKQVFNSSRCVRSLNSLILPDDEMTMQKLEQKLEHVLIQVRKPDLIIVTVCLKQ